MDIDKVMEEVNNSLHERDRIFPKRDEQNDRVVKIALNGFNNQINEMLGEAFFADPALVGNARSVLDSPLFLCGAMKSGTTLLLELLDGHPELVALPGDSHFLGRMSKNDPPDETQILAAWDDWLKRMVNPTGQYPFWIFGYKTPPYVEFRQYLQYWYDQLPNSWQSSVVSVMLSYYCANPMRPVAPKLWVEKTPGNEFRCDLILEKFPGARFIHIVRDPRENMASLKKLYSTRDWRWDLIETAGTLTESCRLADANQHYLGKEKYHVLSYEALTENTGTKMSKLTDFLDIQWNESLLQPTVNGVPAHANSMYEDRQIAGRVRKSTKDKWPIVLTGREQRAALGTIKGARRVGYEWNTTVTDSVLLLLDKGLNKIKRSLVERR